METPITRAEHEEFRKRIEGRLEQLEEYVKEIRSLASSVAELAASMKSMSEEQKNIREEQEKQGTRLQMLENRDGEMWRSIVNYVITTIIGIAIGYIFTRWGIN